MAIDPPIDDVVVNGSNVNMEMFRVWGRALEDAIDQTLQSAGFVYATLANLTANTTAAAGSRAEVREDSTAANNGIYSKNSGAGWTKISDLPGLTFSISNANLAVDNGLYRIASSGTNIPTSDHYIINVEAYDIQVTQTAFAYAVDTSADTRSWRRSSADSGSTWSAWYRIRRSEEEITALITSLVQATKTVTDANTAIVNGLYVVSSTGTNIPTVADYTIRVENNGGATVAQTAWAHGQSNSTNTRLYRRKSTNSGSTWETWYSVEASTVEIQALIDASLVGVLRTESPTVPLFFEGKKLEIAFYRIEDEQLVLGQDVDGGVVLPGLSTSTDPGTDGEIGSSFEDDVYLKTIGTVDQLFVAHGDGETQITSGETDWVGGHSANHAKHVIGTMNGRSKRVSKSLDNLVRPTGDNFLWIWIVTGQSVAIGAEAPVVTSAALYPQDALMLNIGNPIWWRTGEAALSAATVTSIVPMIEGAATYYANAVETLSSGFAASWIARSDRYIGKRNKTLFIVSGGSGMQYDYIKKGGLGPIYQNSMTAFERAADLAIEAGLTPRLAGVILVHGEADHSLTADLTGTARENARVAYRDAHEDLRTDYRDDCFAALATLGVSQSGEIELYMTQASSWSRADNGDPDDATSIIPWAMFEAHLMYPRVHLAGPKYQWVHEDSGSHSDGAHIYDQRSQGELFRHVHEEVDAGIDWYPIAPIATGTSITGITRSAAVISVQYPRNVTIDTTLVSNPGNNGFEYSDSAGNTIIGVNVRSGDARFIDITLSANPSGASNRLLAYAYTGVLGNPGGPTTGPRGNVRAATGYRTELANTPTDLANSTQYDWGIHWGRFAVP